MASPILEQGGLFDRHPDLNVILGHLGEILPFNIWRIDHRISYMGDLRKFSQPLTHYLQHNFYVTTSGNFRTQALVASGEHCRRASPGTACHHPDMEMTLRIEIFPRDLDAAVDFYTRILGFSVTKDQRQGPELYAALERGRVRIGVGQGDVPHAPPERRPPIGTELVLEVDDVAAERDRIVAEGWPLVEDLQYRRWGLTDFRILDPEGYYLRITSRA